MPLGCVIYLPKLCRVANGVLRCWNFWHSEVLLHIRRGASALLVSMDRAILRSLKSEASDSIGLHVFFLFYGYKKSIAINLSIYE